MAAKDCIFLAHASEDKLQVRQLYQQLKERGFSPWLDAIDLVPGQNWREEIPKVIENAAVCLACLSKRSVAKEGYVQREFRYALSAYADRPPGAIYLIPARLDDCEVPDMRIAKLELNLRDLHWVDLFDVDGFEKLVGAIELNVGISDGSSTNHREPFGVFKDVNAPWCPEMVSIPAGRLFMGSPESEPERMDREGPQHWVSIERPFALGRYPVTRGEFASFVNETGYRNKGAHNWTGKDWIYNKDADWRSPGFKQTDKHPVVSVNHEDALAFLAWLSAKAGGHYELPSEAQWEYACRAGTLMPFWTGSSIGTDQANYDGNLPYGDGNKGIWRKGTTDVDSFAPNPFGLYDMHGNVWERCADRWHDNYDGAPSDETAWLGDRIGHRVLRGGSWILGARDARSASRRHRDPEARYDSIGFRCAKVR